MPFCPSCGYEYQNFVTKCPDCNVELVDTLPDHNSESVQLVEIYTGPKMMAQMLADFLKDREIPSILTAIDTYPDVVDLLPLNASVSVRISSRDVLKKQADIQECITSLEIPVEEEP
jgi:hypothetical protein